MDFLDDRKKRAHRNRLFIGYGLMAIAVGIATVILVFATNGYGVNPGTGKITQFGLLFVDSHPDGSELYLNGERKGTTSARMVLEENEYNLEIKREGYRSWQRNFLMEARAVERYAYPFLFPIELNPEDVRLLAPSTDMASSSPDRRWIISHNPATFSSFDVTDTTTKENQTAVISIPTTILPVRPGTKIEAVEWSTDNRHLLIRAAYEGGADFVLIDRDAPAESLNFTQHFGQAFSQVRLRDKSPNKLYVYDAAGGLLRSVDVPTKQFASIASGVVSFWPYENDLVLYATTDKAPSSTVIVAIQEGAQTHILRQLPVSDAYLLNVARFNGKWYFVAGTSAEGKVYVYVNPLDDLREGDDQLPDPNVLLKVDGARYVSFSANARFIGVQGGAKFAVYDAELGRQSRYDIGLPVDGATRANWMDGHRFTLLSQNKMYVFDYDGTNKQELLAAESGFEAMFDRDYNNLFTISKSVASPESVALLRTSLRAEE